MPPSSGYELRIGIDIGGTFTDFVYFDPAASRLETFKLLSTPLDPSEAVLAGLRTDILPHRHGYGMHSDSRLDGCYQRFAGAQRRQDGSRHHTRIPGCAPDRQAEPAGIV